MQLSRRSEMALSTLLLLLLFAFGIVMTVVCSQPASAALLYIPVDRHVYLNSSGGGTQLNNCPNPAHNPRAIAGNTDEMTYCVNGTHDGKLTTGVNAPRTDWTVDPVLDATCVSGGGTVTAASNGALVDVDGDGVKESIYGNGQACVYNMGQSDTCEVHSGVYKAPGLRALDTTDLSSGIACARSECFQGFIGAFGNGPTLNANGNPGYGTAAAPGYLRGAVMNGSTDTWDSDGDKVPDCSNVTGSSVCYGLCVGGTNPDSLCVMSGVTTCAGGGTCTALSPTEPDSYPVTFDGDADGDCNRATGAGCWESTFCDSSTCTGDSFYAGFVGCGYHTDESYNCDANIGGGETKPFMDVNANGTFESNEQLTPNTILNVSYFRFKDIEFRYFNGGPVATSGSGVREYIGAFQLPGGNAFGLGDGMGVEHIFWHDGFYSRMAVDEAWTAIFGDNENSWGVVPKVIKDSLLFSGNRFVYNDDCGEYGECGGSLDMDGNVIVLQARRSDGAAWVTGTVGASDKGEFQSVFRIKSLDTLGEDASDPSPPPKVYTIRRNVIIRQRGNNSGGISAGLFYNECLGHCWRTQDTDPGPTNNAAYRRSTGYGTVKMYGNIFRLSGLQSPSWTAYSFPFCSVSGLGGSSGNQDWTLLQFNNTWDVEKPGGTTTTPLDYLCNGTGKKYVSRNNAYFGATTVNTDGALTTIYGNEDCDSAGSPYACCSGLNAGTCGDNICSASGFNAERCKAGGSTRTNWFTGAANGNVFQTLARYIPTATGTHVLDGTGSCDPDGDGVQGVDWDNNPATGASGQETSWIDIAGNVVNCASGNVQDIGAIQNSGGGSCLDVCGDGTLCSAVGETCDDGSLATNACAYGDSPPFTQVCSGGSPGPAACRGNVDCSAPAWCGDGIQNGAEQCDGSLPPGTTCPGGQTGTPACTSCVITAGTCTSPPSTSDRHVFLDTDGDGKLNQCPNPSHNTYVCSPPTVPCNTANLQRCVGGTGGSAGKLRGDKAGYLSAVGCPGGAFVDVANGDTADIDQDGNNEALYGSPQACVWNFAKSNSCEIHAGTYKAAGAQCDGSCGDQSGVDAAGSGAAAEGTINVCDKFDCFKASIVALGDGPNMDGTGYGTALAPGRVRGAQMGGSTDSWDPNGDKNPADGLYPAIISGDADGNGAFTVTSCSGSTCTGDSFNAVIMGCGYQGQYFCRTSPLGSSGYIRIDTNADGTVDTNAGVFAVGSKEVDHLIVSDLEFTRYNGGNGAYFSGVRPRTGRFTMDGAHGATNGLAIRHIYNHDNDYTLGIDNYWDDNVSNEGFTETTWADFNDQFNAGCTTPTEISDSFLVQNNARLFDYDCDSDDDCGCETYIHDNRILVDVDPAKAGVLYRNNVEGGPVPGTGAFTKIHSTAVSYIKAIGDNPREHRFYNNEFVIKSMGTSRGYFMDLQGFGSAQGTTGGALWIYGNLFREDPAVSQRMNRFWQGFCDVDSGAFVYKNFLNTFDLAHDMGAICSDTGTTIVEKDNAYLRVTGSLFTSTATNDFVENNATSTLAADRVLWFNPGSFSSGNPGTHGGLANYVPRIGNALYEKVHNGSTILNPCDPDRDGILGANYYGAGNVTTWTDLAGNTVDCSGGTISYGAIQPNNDSAVPQPTQIKDAKLKSATIK